MKVKKCSLSKFNLAIFTLMIMIISNNINCEQKISKNSVKVKKSNLKNKDDIDALGYSVRNNLTFKTFPFDVKTCDVKIQFPAEYITNLTDYRYKTKVYYHITVHRISMFQYTDPTVLIHSVLLSNLKTLPGPLHGARNCLSIDAGSVTAEITMCFDSKAKMQNILDQLVKFDRCRSGDNLTVMSDEMKAKLQKMCDEQNDKKIQVKDPSLKIYKPKPRPGNKWDQERNLYLYAKDYVVPGTFDLIEDIKNKEKQKYA
jgi:hypothetical protein